MSCLHYLVIWLFVSGFCSSRRGFSFSLWLRAGLYLATFVGRCCRGLYAFIFLGASSFEAFVFPADNGLGCSNHLLKTHSSEEIWCISSTRSVTQNVHTYQVVRVLPIRKWKAQMTPCDYCTVWILVLDCTFRYESNFSYPGRELLPDICGHIVWGPAIQEKEVPDIARLDVSRQVSVCMATFSGGGDQKPRCVTPLHRSDQLLLYKCCSTVRKKYVLCEGQVWDNMMNPYCMKHRLRKICTHEWPEEPLCCDLRPAMRCSGSRDCPGNNKKWHAWYHCV